MKTISSLQEIIVLLVLLFCVHQSHAQFQPDQSFSYEPIQNDQNVELIAFSVSGSKKLITGAYFLESINQTNIIVWESKTNQQLFIFTIDDFIPSVGVFSLVFSPDDQILAAGMSGAVKLFDLSNGSGIRTIETSTRVTPPGIGSPAGVNAIAFSPDGGMLVTNENFMGKIQFWDPSTGGEILNAIRPEITPDSLSFSKNNIWLLARKNFNAFLILAETGEIVRTYPESFVTLSDDGKHLYTLEFPDPNDIVHYIVHKRRIDDNAIVSESEKHTLPRRDAGISEILKDGTLLLLNNERGVSLINLNTGSQTPKFEADSFRNFDRIEVSANGQNILTSKNDRLFLFDISNLTSGISHPNY